VSYWEQIGDLEFGQGLTVPLIINFNSNRASSSPYLGAGWLLPLFEASFLETELGRFTLLQPDGAKRAFSRSSALNGVLRGSGNWLAQVQGDEITAWADCGWSLTFNKGRISSIRTPDRREF